MSFKVIFSVLVCALIFSFTYAFAGVPQMINYQGKLTDADGKPTNDTLQMVFSIYADSIGGTALWDETQTSVIVEKGVFSVLLGSVDSIPYSVFNGNTRYLGVKVGEDTEIVPRKPIVSVGYSYRSSIADSAIVASPPKLALGESCRT